MAIKTVIELSRDSQQGAGEQTELTRTFRVELTSPLSVRLVVAACGVSIGSPHPDFPDCVCYNISTQESVAESSDSEPSEEPTAIVVEVVAQYKPEDDPNPPGLLPWERADVWKFQTQGAAVPALFYYDGQTQKPLTNSAGDYFEGLTIDEAQQKVTITANRLAFPSALAAAITNCVNASPFLGFGIDCVKVQGISGEIASEEVGETTYYFWKITTELLCRQTGWNLLLPDVGFNFIEGGVKKRADVEGPDGEQIASANPIALNGNGGKVAGGGFPAILNRRVYRQINMSSFFGSPPT
jgi:hypothetical protein